MILYLWFQGLLGWKDCKNNVNVFRHLSAIFTEKNFSFFTDYVNVSVKSIEAHIELCVAVDELLGWENKRRMVLIPNVICNKCYTRGHNGANCPISNSQLTSLSLQKMMTDVQAEQKEGKNI